MPFFVMKALNYMLVLEISQNYEAVKLKQAFMFSIFSYLKFIGESAEIQFSLHRRTGFYIFKL